MEIEGKRPLIKRNSLLWWSCLQGELQLPRQYDRDQLLQRRRGEDLDDYNEGEERSVDGRVDKNLFLSKLYS